MTEKVTACHWKTFINWNYGANVHSSKDSNLFKQFETPGIDTCYGLLAHGYLHYKISILIY